ncbi:MAG TPA: hypothetical protein VFK57_07025 [Vicinamibacterales bacterium]|nr:hypothetical protein [Vicinamibacterales bacterium]
MKRREFVEKLGVGSVTLAAAGALGSVAAGKQETQDHHSQLDGPLANATVSFGQWMLPLDRYPNNSPRQANHHKLRPYEATIRAGGAVTFQINGVHLVLIYAPGTTLDSITRNVVEATPGPPPFPGFVDDSTNRVYRGLDPRPLPQDRQETVTFAEKGTYLVVCGLVPHFDQEMHGFVKVV